jgi:hypothetical protein
MNAVTHTEPVSSETLELVLGTGDLAKLTPGQRVEYMVRTCQSLGLNPLTRPFRFLALNGQVQLYATRDCTDQLRKLHGINLQIVDKKIDSDLFVVTVRARTKDGREDEDIGAVTLGQLRGDSRANALMKGLTKAKRRVTLSICGLGLMSEDELDTVPGARTFDAEIPVAPIVEATSERERINQEIPLADNAPPRPRGRTAREFIEDVRGRMNDAADLDAVNAIIADQTVQRAMATFRNGAKDELDGVIAYGISRFGREPAAEQHDWDDEAPAEENRQVTTAIQRMQRDSRADLEAVNKLTAHQTWLRSLPQSEYDRYAKALEARYADLARQAETVG